MEDRWGDKCTEMFPDVQLDIVFFLLYELEAELINCVFLDVLMYIRDIRDHKAYLIVFNKII